MTYRVVGHVVVLVLASASANAFSALHLVNQVGLGKGCDEGGHGTHVVGLEWYCVPLPAPV